LTFSGNLFNHKSNFIFSFSDIFLFFSLIFLSFLNLENNRLASHLALMDISNLKISVFHVISLAKIARGATQHSALPAISTRNWLKVNARVPLILHKKIILTRLRQLWNVIQIVRLARNLLHTALAVKLVCSSIR